MSVADIAPTGWDATSEGSDILEVLDPDDGSLVATYPTTNPAHATRIVARAVAAQRSLQPPSKRAQILSDTAELLEGDLDRFATPLSREGIKTLSGARAEVARAARTLHLSAAQVGAQVGEVLHATATGDHGAVHRRPAGVVLAICPYNDPLNLVAHKLGPAIAAGCPVVLCPDPRTPTPAFQLLSALQQSGLRADQVQIVLGRGAVLETLLADPDVRVVSATGGHRLAERILAHTGIKRLVLELGGICPAIVTSDTDLEHAAASIAAGSFDSSGQNCLHTQIVFVVRPVLEPFMRLLIEHTQRWQCGRKDDARNECGPMIDERAAIGVHDLVADALAHGGKIAVRAPLGADAGDLHVPGIVLTDVPHRARLWRTEVFGPVVMVEGVDDLDAALDSAARTDGLQASIFTDRLSDVTAAIARLRHGSIVVNACDRRDDAMPFGGTGSAGLGREGPAYVMGEYTEKQVLLLGGSAR